MTIPTIDELPTPPPTRNDPLNFPARGDAHVAAQVTMVTQMNASIAAMNTTAAEVDADAAAAAASAANAAASANVTKWVSGTNYTEGDNVWEPTAGPSQFQTFRRRVTGAGATNPAADPDNWEQISFNPLNEPTFDKPQIIALRTKRVAMAANDVVLSSGDLFTKTIAANTTFTFSDFPAGSDVLVSIIMEITNGGAFAVDWWSGIDWTQGGGPPSLTVSGTDVLGLYSYDGGANWTGLVLARNKS